MSKNSYNLCKAAVVLSIPVLLGGCSVVHALGFGNPKSPMPEPRQALAMTDASPGMGSSVDTGKSLLTNTEAGRAALNTGDTSKAITMFQRALAMGEERAVALNGLGVAYARQGRNDLARQYFMIAIEADPNNAGYSRNLAKLLQETSPVRTVAPASATYRSAAAPAPARPAAGLERVGANEYRIRTASAAPVKAAAPRASGPLPVIRVAGRSALLTPAQVAAPSNARASAVQMAANKPEAAPVAQPRLGKAKVIDGFQALARVEFTDVGTRVGKGTRAK